MDNRRVGNKVAVSKAKISCPIPTTVDVDVLSILTDPVHGLFFEAQPILELFTHEFLPP